MKRAIPFLIAAFVGVALHAQQAGLMPGSSGGGGSSVVLKTNGTKNSTQSLLNLAAGTNITLGESGGTVTVTASSTAATAFSALTSSTNTTAAMVVGSGASLASTGTGTIQATSVPAAGLGAGTLGNDIAGNAATATAPQAGHSTGTGNFVLATSPTLVTPALGTPSALVLTNATGKPASIDLTNGSNLPFSALPPHAWGCQVPLGDGVNVIPVATYPTTICKNTTGHTVTITGIQCFTDLGSSSTLNVTNSAGTGLLTGPATCSSSFASGTQSATTTLAAGDYLKFSFVADGTAKQTAWVIVGTY
jgi:hypothetical protein